MNYLAMKWVHSPNCKVKGSARAVLALVAYHENPDTGETWVGQRTLAQSSGLARATVQRALDYLFTNGILEPVEDHQGTRAERYRIAPHLYEDVPTADTMSAVPATGEVIHNPGASGLTTSPLEPEPNFLVDSSRLASGLTQHPNGSLVDSSSEASGLIRTFPIRGLTSAKSQMSESQGYKQGLKDSREVQDVGDDTTADAVVADVVYVHTYPEVSEAHKAYLREKFGPKSKSGQERPAFVAATTTGQG